jgi:MYXO-CTERM domain-containing protein
MKSPCMFLLGLSLVSSTAFANPIMTVMQLSAVVTGNTHVRLRYLTNNWSDWTMSDMVFHGTGHSEWFTTGETTSRNTGSGSQTMTYRFACDCYVPTGAALTYKVTGASSYIPDSDVNVTVTPTPNDSSLCDEKCLQVARADASVSGTPSGSSSSDAKSSQDPPPEQGGGSCSLSSHGHAGVFPLLPVLGLLALCLRRRQ